MSGDLAAHRHGLLHLIGAICMISTLNLAAVAQEGNDESFRNGGDQVDVGDDGAVELHVADMPLATVLRMLSVQGKRNIIATPAVTGSVTADLYDVTFEEALDAVLATNNCVHEESGGFIYVYTHEEFDAIKAEAAPSRARIFHLNYIRAADIAPVVESLLSVSGSIVASPAAVVGLNVSPSDAGGDSSAYQDYIVVLDDPDVLDDIAHVIKELDVRPKQVLLEATILRARLTDDNALGIDFTLVGGVDLELLGSISDPIGDVITGPLPTVRFDDFNFGAQTDFASNVPDGGLTLGILQDHVAVFLRALEQITDTSVIANPKVLTLNKQVGNVIVGRRDGYITTTVTETQAVQKVEFLETGTQLTFRPFVGDDGYIRMELRPEDSVGGLTPAQLPFERTTEVTTNIMIRDGNTILIGGLFREVDEVQRSQLPVLGDLPGFGNLFRSNDDTVDREEVIILLTVHIIKDNDRFAAMSEQAKQDIERTRVGLRSGALWSGRERIAQSHYRAALDHLANGDASRALWDARWAVRNSPRFLEAIKLEERIRDKREWESTGSIARNFVADLIMEELGESGNPFGHPPWPPIPVNEPDATEER